MESNSHAEAPKETESRVAGPSSQATIPDIQRQFIGRKIQDVWACNIPGHTICVLSRGGHHQISEIQLYTWIEAIHDGNATVRNPPLGLLPNEETSHAASVADNFDIHSIAASVGTEASVPFRTLQYTPSLASSIAGSSTGIVSSSMSPGQYTGKRLQWLGSLGMGGMGTIVSYVTSREFYTLLRNYQREVDAWDKLWNKTPPHIAQFQRTLSDFQAFRHLNWNARPLSSVQKEALAFISELCDGIIAMHAGLSDEEFRNAINLEDMVWQMELAMYTIRELSPVKSDLHPPPSILTNLRRSMNVEYYDILIHIIIIFMAYKLLCTVPGDLKVDIADARLFRVALHAATHPKVRFYGPVLDILHSVGADRKNRNMNLSALHRPFEVAIFGLCARVDTSFNPFLNGPSGLPVLFKALGGVMEMVASNNDTELVWLEVYRVLHALHEILLQIPGIVLDMETALPLLRFTVVKIPKIMRQPIRRVLVDTIAALLCSFPAIFQRLRPHQLNVVQLCSDTLRAWKESEPSGPRKVELAELCELLEHLSRTS